MESIIHHTCTSTNNIIYMKCQTERKQYLQGYRQTYASYNSSRLTLIMLQNLSFAKFSSASIFCKAPIYFKFVEYVVHVPNRLGPDETPSYSASHLGPSYLHLTLRSCSAWQGLMVLIETKYENVKSQINLTLSPNILNCAYNINSPQLINIVTFLRKRHNFRLIKRKLRHFRRKAATYYNKHFVKMPESELRASYPLYYSSKRNQEYV